MGLSFLIIGGIIGVVIMLQFCTEGAPVRLLWEIYLRCDFVLKKFYFYWIAWIKELSAQIDKDLVVCIGLLSKCHEFSSVYTADIRKSV